jgi:hypothetical protein
VIVRELGFIGSFAGMAATFLSAVGLNDSRVISRSSVFLPVSRSLDTGWHPYLSDFGERVTAFCPH